METMLSVLWRLIFQNELLYSILLFGVVLVGHNILDFEDNCPSLSFCTDCFHIDGNAAMNISCGYRVLKIDEVTYFCEKTDPVFVECIGCCRE